MYTTKALADRLEVDPQTVRRWARQYSDHMSEGSSHADALQFTDDDLLLLWSVRRWRQLGYSLGEIADRLGRGERTTEAPPEIATEDQPARAVMVSEGAHTAALAEIRRLEGERERLLTERDKAIEDKDTLNQQIRALEREIGELRGTLAERRSVTFWLIVVTAAMFLTAILILALILPRL